MLTMAGTDPRSDVGGPKTIARDLRWPGPAVSPGEMLREEFLQPLGISPAEAARRMEISAHRLNEIVEAKCRVTVDTAWRLSRLLKTSPQFWMRLQADWDILSRGRADRVVKSGTNDQHEPNRRHFCRTYPCTESEK